MKKLYLFKPIAIFLVFGIINFSVVPVWAQEILPTQLPVNGHVVGGDISIAQAGSTMNITQSTQQGIINWDAFNIGAQAQVNFHQPSSSASTLNRVLDSNPTKIFGRINANGQVFLTNPNGVYFSPSSSVDVGSFTASTHAISDHDFMSGRYLFSRDGSSGSIINEGTLNSSIGGYIALLAPELRNEGVIIARQGTVAMAAGDEIELQFNDQFLTSVRVSPSTIKSLITNNQAVEAPGGLIILSANAANKLQGAVINNNGSIEANSLANVNGRVLLQADNGSIYQQGLVSADSGDVDISADYVYLGKGSTNVASQSENGGEINIHASSGIDAVAHHTLDASGANGGMIALDTSLEGSMLMSSLVYANGLLGQGGLIQMTAGELSLLSPKIIANGLTKGGTIHIGGDWQGKGSLAHSTNTYVNAGALLSAQSQEGEGGEIVVWSDKNTGFVGTAQTQGLIKGGGIEISSKGYLALSSDNVFAGEGGQVLFDPKNITIADIAATLATWRRVVTTSTFSISTIGAGVDTRDFGQSIAMDGDLLAIGYYSQDSTKGSVYMLTGANSANFGTLTLQGRLGDSTGATSMTTLTAADGFGRSISLDGGNLAVGAWGDSTYKGAVYLFNGVGADFSGLTYRTKVATSSGATNMPALTNYDYFGRSVSIDADRMVVGAIGDDTGGSSRGAVYLFSGLTSAGNFANLTYRNKITSAATSVAASMPALNDTDWFGSGVGLDGDLLAVGAPNSGADGVVHLFADLNTANDSDYSGLTWLNALGSATTSVAASMPSFGGGSNEDSFGTSVDLSNNRLAVGAWGDDTGNIGAGALYLFTGTAANFGTLAYDTRIRSSSGATSMTSLGINDSIGLGIALDGDHLAGGGQGMVHFLSLAANGATSDSVASATFANNASSDSTITPAVITAILNAGTAVTLQANNDITVSSAVTANNAGGNGGAFSLYAGRNITISAAITTDSGNFAAYAGDAGADGANKDAGTPALTVSGALNSGAGSIILSSVGGTLSGSGTITASNNNLTLFAGTSTGTLSGVIALGSGTLTKQGTGITLLSAANTYTGATTVSAGTLAVSNATGLGTVAGGVTVESGAILDIRGATVGAEAITLNGGTIKTSTGTSSLSGTVGMSANSYIDVGGTQLTLSGVISGVGLGIEKTSSGILVLSGTNTYSGATTITAGTLTSGANDVLSNSTAVSIASGATFNLNSKTDTIASIAGAGNISLGSGTLTTGGANTSTTLSGIISGAGGGIVKAGTGTFTLSGTNTYTGTTSVSAGILEITNNSGLGTIAGATTVSDGATLLLNGVSIGAEPITLNGAGVSSLGALKNSGTSSGSGAVTVSSSSTIGGSGTLTLGNSTLADSATLTIGTGLALNATLGTISGTAGGASSSVTVNTSGSATLGVMSTDLDAVSITAANTSLAGITSNTIAITDSGANGVTLTGALTANASNDLNALRIVTNKFTNSFGANALNASNGSSRWLVWSSTPTADTRNGQVYDFKQYGATYGVTTPGGSGDGFLYSLTSPTLTASLTGTTSKVSNGSNAATLISSNYSSVTGAIDGDTVSINNPSTGVYATTSPGTNILVTASGIVLTATDGSATVYGYTMPSSITGSIGTITSPPSTTPPPPARPSVDLPGSASSSLEIGAGSGMVNANAISIAMINEPTSAMGQTGLITVKVPSETAVKGNGFVISIPAEMGQKILSESAPVKVTLANNKPLPNWIKYDSTTKSIVVSSVPDGSFPLQILITSGTEKTIMVISEQSAK